MINVSWSCLALLTSLNDVVPDSKENCELYINPQIDKTNKDSTQRGDEGCLSIPGLTLSIERFDKIKVRYYDINGKVIKKPLKGFISRLFQHELDHLNGNLMFENPLSSISIKEAQSQELADMLMEVINYIQNK